MTGSSFQLYLERRFPTSQITPISDTNNQVFRIESPTGRCSAKLMTDADIPPRYLIQCNAQLASRLRVPDTIELLERSAGAPFDAIIGEFVDGVDLASALATGADGSIDDDAVVTFMLRYLAVLPELPRLFSGFGLFKAGGPTFDAHAAFLRSYADKYWGRLRPFVDDADRARVDPWVENGLAAASFAPTGHQCVAADSNLRNFLVTGDGDLVLLNIPIVGWSTRAHAVAAISAHLRPFPLRRTFLEQATAGWSEMERQAVHHLEAWTLLGILSFYAVRAPNAPETWRNWGATRNLKEDFLELVQTLT